MTVTSGFFNSVNHDRKYNAEEISSIFDGVILDGVYQGFGEALKVEGTSTANQVKIGTGRAWFNHTWTLNDEALYLTIPSGNSTYPRIDVIVLEVNNNASVRQNSIKCITGVAASSPIKPSLTNTTDIHQYPLAYINRPKGTSNIISASDIENKIGTSECPIVTGVLEVLNDDRFIAQTIANLTDDFNSWFEGIKGMLDEDAATSLANKISALEKSFNTKIASIYSMFSSFAIGDNLGSSITQDQLKDIKNGTFSGKLGDYWYINGNIYMIIGVDDFYSTNITCEVKGRHHLSILASLASKLSDTYNIEYTDTMYDSAVATASDRYAYIVNFAYTNNGSYSVSYMVKNVFLPYEKLIEPPKKYIDYIKNDIGSICLSHPIWANDGFINIKQVPVTYSYLDESLIPTKDSTYYMAVSTSSVMPTARLFNVGNSKLPFNNGDELIDIYKTFNSLTPFWMLLREKYASSILKQRVINIKNAKIPENDTAIVYTAPSYTNNFYNYAYSLDFYNSRASVSTSMTYSAIYDDNSSLYTPIQSEYSKYYGYKDGLIYDLNGWYGPSTILNGPSINAASVNLNAINYGKSGDELEEYKYNTPNNYTNKAPYATYKTTISDTKQLVASSQRLGSILICI